MEISLIISGNLTGFSRFYATPNADDVYSEAKFDFDYRNFLTFLQPGEKAYAISFSPNIIAVSLVTRILDSFRRPGILVVTALIHRYQLVRGQLNQSDKAAIFNLLNEVNDRFYEKNFINGVVNQNPAVLMQDYYSDILSRYTLVSDRMQKPVNAGIDIATPNKRIGYVAAAESSMPRYLASVMRKSYEGYHHVFLSANAPQNIDEPAEEIVTYRARIENGNRPVPGEVRLTDRIPNVGPAQGEKDIPNKNFTYGQVLAGEAAPDITGTIENGETIVLTYHFHQEEKTVNFKFYDGTNEVPIHIIRPVIVESNGLSLPLSTDSWTFRGKEIYGRKTIKSGNPEYNIFGPAANLDLQRVQNGATININVERGWVWEFAPKKNGHPVTIKPVNITLINRYNGDRRTFTNVTSAISEKLSGTAAEWEMVIESDYYKDVRVPAGAQYRLDLKPAQPQPNITPGPKNKGSQASGTQNRGMSAGQDSPGLKISTGSQPTAKDAEQIRREKLQRYMQFGVALLAACLVLWLGIWGFKSLFGDDKKEAPKAEAAVNEDVVVNPITEEVKEVSFKFVDSEGDAISSETLGNLWISVTSNQEIIDNGDFKYTIKYQPDNEDAGTVNIVVSHQMYDNTIINLLPSKSSLAIKDLNGEETIGLSVKESDIKLYTDIKDTADKNNNKKLTKQQYDTFVRKATDIRDKRNYDYGAFLLTLLSRIKQEESAPSNPPAGNATEKRQQDSEVTEPEKDVKFHLWWTADQVAQKKNEPEYKDYLDELRAIEDCLKGLNRRTIVNPEKLPSNFKGVMNQLQELQDEINNISNKSTRQRILKRFQELLKEKSQSVNKEQDILVQDSEIRNLIKSAREK